MAVTSKIGTQCLGADYSSPKVKGAMPAQLASITEVNRVALKALKEAIELHKSARHFGTPFGTPMDTPDGTSSRGSASSGGSFTSCGTPGTEFPHVE
jgi:hypothetical protein